MSSHLTRLVPRAIAQLLNHRGDSETAQSTTPESSVKLDLNSLHCLADEALMEQVQSGSHDAFAVLHQRYHRLVHRIACSILRSDVEAEDVVQEIFANLFRATGKYDPAKSTYKVWLLMYAYHRSIDKKRSLVAKRYYATDAIEDTDVEACLERGTRRALSLQPVEASVLMNKALGMLPDRERLAVQLVCYEGLTLAEASKRSELSLKTLEHCYYRGIKKLREIINLTSETKRNTEPVEVKVQTGAADAPA